ncbi:MAG: hypothetical protein EB141_09045 [Verrucomicrobia bacterium]|nr:hypothetical protein [Verrucomicrobiota bacterium]NBU07663.1 hypothetical protein [Pseudomonadota bacterium]NDA65251.1 hypothetical protein [Verrucomicrobiota bacterium]NDB75774.1 hypothetical protein [Verrucomicrobiota bacterium]NDD36993.1 hypothetical protein [Verrucomicrobiota bacterium]
MLNDNEWKWPTRAQKVLADWELNGWLNYEFARSYRPMVKWVLELRSDKKPTPRQEGELPVERRNPPRFATFLVKHFPEFPAHPWLAIPETERRARLRKVGINEHTSLFDQKTVQEIDLDIYTYRTAVGDCDHDPADLGDAADLFVRINFHRTDKQILRRLAQIVTRRREQLKTLHAEKVRQHVKAELRGNPPWDPTAVTHNRRGVGKRENPGVIYSRMNELSVLRLSVYFAGDLIKVQKATGTLRPNSSNWMRLKNSALDMMIRMRDAWCFSFAPPWVLEPLSPQQITVPRSGRLHLDLPRPEGTPADPAEQMIEREVLRVPGCLA